jgi:hypothetical protein
MGKRPHRRSRCLTSAEAATGYEDALVLAEEMAAGADDA